MPNLTQICEGDVIKFYESLERTYWNKDGARCLRHMNQHQLVRAKVTGKTAKGKLRLEQCLIYKGRDPKRVEKTSRTPEKLFTSFAQLTLISKGERGKLLACSCKSTHPDAKKMYDMKSALSYPIRKERVGSIYDDPLVRALHDDEVRERKAEALAS